MSRTPRLLRRHSSPHSLSLIPTVLQLRYGGLRSGVRRSRRGIHRQLPHASVQHGKDSSRRGGTLAASVRALLLFADAGLHAKERGTYGRERELPESQSKFAQNRQQKQPIHQRQQHSHPFCLIKTKTPDQGDQWMMHSELLCLCDYHWGMPKLRACCLRVL